MTPDDELAARYALLRFATNYPERADLRAASDCLSNKEIQRLVVLNDEFTFQDLRRIDAENRSAETTARWDPVMLALARRDVDAFKRATKNPETFSLRADSSDIPMIPANKLSEKEKDMSQALGELAIRRIAMAGPVLVSCYQAINDQGVNVLAAVAIIGDKTLGTVARFAGNRKPATDATRAEDRKLEALNFMSIDDLKGLYNWTSWPGRPCPALAGT